MCHACDLVEGGCQVGLPGSCSVYDAGEHVGEVGESGGGEGVCDDDDGIGDKTYQEMAGADWTNGCMAALDATQAQWNHPFKG